MAYMWGGEARSKKAQTPKKSRSEVAKQRVERLKDPHYSNPPRSRKPGLSEAQKRARTSDIRSGTGKWAKHEREFKRRMAP